MKRFRVWYVPQLPCKSFSHETETLDEARTVLDILQRFSLFEFENRIKPDYADMGGIEEWDEDEGEWYEVEEDDAMIAWEDPA